jgi:hypothetical protein
VHKATREGHGYVIFEMFNDAQYLQLIKALLSRNYKTFKGIEAYNREDALNNLRKLTNPGWNAEYERYTSEQSILMALTALRHIDMFLEELKWLIVNRIALRHGDKFNSMSCI